MKFVNNFFCICACTLPRFIVEIYPMTAAAYKYVFMYSTAAATRFPGRLAGDVGLFCASITGL